MTALKTIAITLALLAGGATANAKDKKGLRGAPDASTADGKAVKQGKGFPGAAAARRALSGLAGHFQEVSLLAADQHNHGHGIKESSFDKTVVPLDAPARRLDTACGEDDPTWEKAGSSGTKKKDCNWVALGNSKLNAQGNNPRCFKENEHGVKANEVCMAACGCSEDVDVGEASCDEHGCCDSVTWSFKNPQQGCDWVSDNTRRCRKISKSDDVPAFKGCPYACGTCATDAWSQLATAQGALATAESDLADAQTDRTVCQGQLAASESNLVDKTNELVLCQATDQPTGAPAKSFPILDETATTAQKTQCLAAKGQWEGLTDDFCGTCCPACTAVDTSSFASHFDGLSLYSPTDTSRCICLDLDLDTVAYKAIDLTSFSDCARIRGGYFNRVYGQQGNDAMYANGVGNELYGDGGDDHVAAGGSGGRLWGGWDNDVCTDLGFNKFYNELYPDDYHACETCLGPAGEPLDCATGNPPPPPAPSANPTTRPVNPPLPEILSCFQDPSNAADYCGTCCPECMAFVGADSFKNSFATSFHLWAPNAGVTGCVCLDLAEDGYNNYDKGGIELTPHSDCVRIVGNMNSVVADPSSGSVGGDDAIYIHGDSNNVDGKAGDDHIVMKGADGQMAGGSGSDVCTDLGPDNFFLNQWASTSPWICESCFGPGGEELSCATGDPFPSPVSTDTAKRTECLAAKGQWEGLTKDFCGTCCPTCTAVVGKSSFTSHFENDPTYGAWYPNAGVNGCVCLDLDEDGHNIEDAHGDGSIYLTSSSDCLRVTGNDNVVYGDPRGPTGGDDAMYSNGVGNRLRGMYGDDHLAAGGSGTQLWGDGDNDVCTDLSGTNKFYNQLNPGYDKMYACETCFGLTGDIVNCDTGTRL